MAKSSNSSNSAVMPAYLADALNSETLVGGTDQFFEPERLSVNLRRIEIPQRTSSAHLGHAGEIAIVSGSGDRMEVEYTKTMRLLLMDFLFFDRTNAEKWMLDDARINRHLAQGIGGRTMWAFDENGQRKVDERAPVCSTPNGFNPWPSYLDKEVFDYRTKETVRIGQVVNPDTGLLEPSVNACITCPLGQWVDGKKSHDGKKYQPMCRPTFEYVVWDVDRKELLRMKAVNVGMQLALSGIAAGKNGARYDGAAFPGLKYYFGWTGEFVNAAGEKISKSAYAALPPEDKALWQPVYRNRPMGKPTAERWDVPVYPVLMAVTLNNFNPASLVPQFALLDGKSEPLVWMDKKTKFEVPESRLTGEEYAEYLTTMVQTYIGEDYRSAMMASGLITRLDEAPAASSPALPQGQTAQPALPANGGAANANPPQTPSTGNYSDPFADD